MNSNIPDYKKVSLINEYQESLEKLKVQKIAAQEELERVKKHNSQRLEIEYKRIEDSIKKFKDSETTKQELLDFRTLENSEFKKLVTQVHNDVENFLSSNEFFDYIKDFYNSKKDDITEVIADSEIANRVGIKDYTSSEGEFIIKTKFIDYIFTPSVVKDYVVKKILVS